MIAVSLFASAWHLGQREMVAGSAGGLRRSEVTESSRFGAESITKACMKSYPLLALVKLGGTQPTVSQPSGNNAEQIKSFASRPNSGGNGIT